MSMVQVLDTAIGCIAANELELAMLGICYVLYQDKFELTNAHELERIEPLTAPEEVAIIGSSNNQEEPHEPSQHDLSTGEPPEAA